MDGACYFSDLCGPDVEGSALADSMKPEGVWPFENGPHQWTPGTHKFFGWLVNDANTADASATENDPSDDLTPSMLFGKTFDTATGTDGNVTTEAFKDGVLTIPATQMTPATEQFDFMYSNIVTTGPQADPVGLTFSHLFAAYYFSFTNNSAEKLHLESIKLNVKSEASASIDFSGSGQEIPAPKISTDFAATQSPIVMKENTDVGAGETIDVLDKDFRLIWPQDLTGATVDVVFTAKVAIPYYQYAGAGKGLYSVYKEEAAAGGAYNKDGSNYVYVGKGNGAYNVSFKYNAKGDYEEVVPEATEQEVSRSISLASVTSGGRWNSGEKYSYSLSFSSDVVDLKVVVMKWDGGHGGEISFN